MIRNSSHLSAKEIQLWHSDFVSKHPTGKLDKDTFMATYKQLFPESSKKLTPNLFDTIDKNHDGTIDFNEFLLLAAVGNNTGNIDERLDIIFNLWDVSHDGLLDVNELAHLISALYDRAGVKDRQGDKNPTHRAKEIIKKLDTSGDKKLNKQEFINGLKHDEVIKKLLVPDS
ncbi:unnamed protein product [Rotaria sp. Silwood1]|nr:unnamed protein product [Rotaria sp. Silwood1]CAF1610979.1 unnamed protein product [Rotaria sp. Silwood1]CAF3667553.1 unnamed protein product [Rotaria sp. Silwood1]CAF3771468.1 unnamed protein product [Rotaria sp. Silwood1]CAF4751114.1 unnamed protein product [Rotaria sp. Silwood1]